MYTTLIEVEELRALYVGSPGPLLLDCRFVLSSLPQDQQAGAQAFAEAHLPGAHYLHLEQDLSSAITTTSGRHPLPAPERLLATLRALGLEPGRQVVVYDASGGAFAARVWWLLRWLGHEAVAVLNGGWQAWVEAGAALAVDLPSAQRKDPEQQPAATVDEGMQIDATELAAALSAGRCLLVDARAEERFRGQVEPLDMVAGHVPGAVNLPFTLNLEAGRFRSASALNVLWCDLLQGRDSRQVVHMCGSGVTACVNLLAMEYAGLHGSKLYPGSWSEWIRDPQRPVAGDD